MVLRLQTWFLWGLSCFVLAIFLYRASHDQAAHPCWQKRVVFYDEKFRPKSAEINKRVVQESTTDPAKTASSLTTARSPNILPTTSAPHPSTRTPISTSGTPISEHSSIMPSPSANKEQLDVDPGEQVLSYESTVSGTIKQHCRGCQIQRFSYIGEPGSRARRFPGFFAPASSQNGVVGLSAEMWQVSNVCLVRGVGGINKNVLPVDNQGDLPPQRDELALDERGWIHPFSGRIDLHPFVRLSGREEDAKTLVSARESAMWPGNMGSFRGRGVAAPASKTRQLAALSQQSLPSPTWGVGGGPPLWLGDARAFDPDYRLLNITSKKRPTIVLSTEWFGHLYHSWTELIIPLFVTVYYLRLGEQQLRGVSSYDDGVNILVLGNFRYHSWNYWRKVMLGYERMARELGLHFLPSLAEVAGEVEPRIEKDRSRPFEENFPFPRTAFADVEVWKGGETSKTGGRWCIPPAGPPVILGYMAEFRPVKDMKDLFEADVWRASQERPYQRANDVLWWNSLAEARRIEGGGGSSGTTPRRPAEMVDFLLAENPGAEVTVDSLFTNVLGGEERTSTGTAGEDGEDPAGGDLRTRRLLEKNVVEKKPVHRSSGNPSRAAAPEPNEETDQAVFIIRNKTGQRAFGKRDLANENHVLRYYQENRDQLFPGNVLDIRFVQLENLSFPNHQRALISQISLLLGVTNKSGSGRYRKKLPKSPRPRGWSSTIAPIATPPPHTTEFCPHSSCPISCCLLVCE